jgi:hypothetical protein
MSDTIGYVCALFISHDVSVITLKVSMNLLVCYIQPPMCSFSYWNQMSLNMSGAVIFSPEGYFSNYSTSSMSILCTARFSSFVVVGVTKIKVHRTLLFMTFTSPMAISASAGSHGSLMSWMILAHKIYWSSRFSSIIGIGGIN